MNEVNEFEVFWYDPVSAWIGRWKRCFVQEKTGKVPEMHKELRDSEQKGKQT